MNFTDTLFAPNDEAILEFERWYGEMQKMMSNTTNTADATTADDTADDDTAATAQSADNLAARRARVLVQLLGKGNATAGWCLNLGSHT